MDGGISQKGTVLIVDDVLDDIRFSQRVIAGAFPKLSIQGVQSGAEMIRYLQGEDEFADRAKFPYPVLILLDLVMPRMHGFKVLEWLTNHPPHNSVPVVVLTVSGEVQVAQHAYALGARTFLTKPLKTSEFKETMEAAKGGTEPVTRDLELQDRRKA